MTTLVNKPKPLGINNASLMVGVLCKWLGGYEFDLVMSQKVDDITPHVYRNLRLYGEIGHEVTSQIENGLVTVTVETSAGPFSFLSSTDNKNPSVISEMLVEQGYIVVSSIWSYGEKKTWTFLPQKKEKEDV